MVKLSRCLILLLLFLIPASLRAGQRLPDQNGTFEVYVLEFPELASEAVARINDFRARAGDYLSRPALPPAVHEALSALVIQPPLSEDARLSAAAAAHARDMLSRGYFSHLSPEGLGPMERAASAGYPAAFVGESISALVFESPVPPEEALDRLLRSLFEDALSGRSPEGAPLIFPFYREVGAALSAGAVTVEGRDYYAYLLVVVFGLPEGLVPAEESRGFLLGRISAAGKVVILRPVSSEREVALPLLSDGSFFAPSLLPELYVIKSGETSRLIFVSPGKLTVVR